MKSSCKWTLTKCLFRKKNTSLWGRQVQFLNLPTKIKSLKLLSARYFFFEMLGLPLFSSQKTHLFPPMWGWTMPRLNTFFRLQKLLSELKLQEVLQRNWQQIQNPGRFSRWHGVFFGGTQTMAPALDFCSTRSFCSVVFFVFSNKKNGDFLFVNPCNLVTWVEEMENELRNINSNCVSVSQKKAHVLRG